jgi:hypothetical protein
MVPGERRNTVGGLFHCASIDGRKRLAVAIHDMLAATANAFSKNCNSWKTPLFMICMATMSNAETCRQD